MKPTPAQYSGRVPTRCAYRMLSSYGGAPRRHDQISTSSILVCLRVAGARADTRSRRPVQYDAVST